ncbi:MAG: hypothetical protein Q3966_08240 [Neisseria sp.]|nr:hypothetical protein [Neisseria sp.]
MRLLFAIIWQIRAEYLEFVKNFSPVVVLLSLAALMSMAEGREGGWRPWAAAAPFALLALYAAVAAASVFYDRSKRKIGMMVMRHLAELRRVRQYAHARDYVARVRKKHVLTAFWLWFAIVLLGMFAILVLTYRMTLMFYELLSRQAV